MFVARVPEKTFERTSAVGACHDAPLASPPSLDSAVAHDRE
ncbi:MAG: hypothetical protein U0075_06855 [Thermomicrobiales bacterium]